MELKSRLSLLLLRSAAPALAAFALLVPGAYAQVQMGSQVRITLEPRVTLAQAGGQVPLLTMPPLTLALIGPAQIGTATTTNLFPQVAFGGGFTTIFSFLNTGADTATGNLILTNSQGSPLTTSFSSPSGSSSVGASIPLSIPSGGSQLIFANPVNTGDPTVTGWARVESSGGSLGGVATFQFVSGSNTLTTIVGVLSATLANVATIPLNDDHTVSRDTGYAIANDSSTAINIKIDLVNPDGTIAQTVSPPALNPLAPGAYFAGFLWQNISPTFKFQGSMVLIEQAGHPFAVLALVENGNLFTSIPVIPASAPNIR